MLLLPSVRRDEGLKGWRSGHCWEEKATHLVSSIRWWFLLTFSCTRLSSSGSLRVSTAGPLFGGESNTTWSEMLKPRSVVTKSITALRSRR
jgi:hypothetical protein